jgi:WD40 repeat protein/energy-coupling factor transporter ATP-binding protein EcfA2
MTADAGNNPFVGLRPFESSESLLFFGRQEQTLELLDRLHQHHFVGVIGSSGSGKSSLIRAGLIPRLQAGYLVNDRDRWIISIMKPGQTPICNLADVLLAEPALQISGLTSTTFEQKIKEEGVDAVLNVLNPLWEKNTNFFLLVDQFEELFRFALHQNDFEKKDEAKDFVNIMLALAEHRELPIYVVPTMRSDFIGDCALIYGLPEAMNKSQYIVPRLTRLQLRNAIEGPVRLYRGKINAALTARLLNDAQLINDELPLLQHALMRIWDYEETTSQNGELSLDNYESIGGIEKALSNHADEALQGMSAEELTITKKMFQALTTVDDMGRKIRRPARLSELEELTGANGDQLLSLINRFVEDNRSFLVVNNIPNLNDKLIDISHESLIRQWNTLSQWVDEETESVRIFKRVTDTARLYQNQQGDLLTGNELQRVSEWFAKFKPNMVWAQRYSSDAKDTIQFFHKSQQEWQAQQKEKQRQLQRKRRNRQLLIAGLIGVILLVSGLAISISLNYRSRVKLLDMLALSYWRNSQEARFRNDILGSLFFAAEAATFTSDENRVKNLLIDTDPFLPQASLEKIFPFPDLILGAAFHPDNKQIALAGNDGSIRLIDKETGNILGNQMKHDAPVNSVAFSPDGKQLLSASNDKTARIWELASGKAVMILPHPDAVISAVFRTDGRVVLTACADGYVRFWEAATGKAVDSVKQTDAVTSVALSPDGNELFTTGIGSTAVLWDLKSKKPIQTFKHRDIVTAAAFNHDGTKLLTASRDSTAIIWDAKEYRSIDTLKNTAPITNAVFSPNGENVLTADEGGLAKFWNAANGWRTGSPLKHEGPIYSITFSTDGKFVLTSGLDKLIRLWKLQDESLANKTVFFKHEEAVNTVAFNNDGTQMVSASDDSTARIWDIKTEKQTAVLPHETEVRNAAFSPDGKTIVTASTNGMIRFWDAASGNRLDSINVEKPLANIVYSKDGKKLATASSHKQILVYDAASHHLLDSFTYIANITTIDLNANASMILIAGWDSAARLVNIATRKPTAVFKHKDVVSSAVFSPDEKKVLTASFDFTVRLWDIATQQQLGSSMQHDGSVKNAFFSADGKWVVSTGWDNISRLWDVATKETMMRIKAQKGNASAIFTPGGNTIVTAGYDGYIFFWPIAGDQDIPADLFKLQAKALTGTELNLATSEVQCLPAKDWASIKQAYFEQGRKHYETCHYPAYSLWRRFYPAEAEKVRPDIKPSR